MISTNEKSGLNLSWFANWLSGELLYSLCRLSNNMPKSIASLLIIQPFVSVKSPAHRKERLNKCASYLDWCTSPHADRSHHSPCIRGRRKASATAGGGGIMWQPTSRPLAWPLLFRCCGRSAKVYRSSHWVDLTSVSMLRTDRQTKKQ